MDSNRNHSLEAFLAILSMDALADAQANREWQTPITANGVRFSKAALSRSKSATGAARIMRLPGALANPAIPTIP
jgi:hypothetical protein